MGLRQFFMMIVAALISVSPAGAHEVNPALLEVQEVAPGQHQVLWKQPLKDGRRLRIVPVFPETCSRGSARLEAVGGAVIERWELTCSLDAGQIQFDGLERTLTDVFVRITDQDGATRTQVVRPNAPELDLATDQTGLPVLAYLSIGVEHILFGYDHLLFVLGLCLLVKPRQLIITITAFTLAHSITLSLSTLGGISLPGPPVEAIIALSIVLLAREALALQQGHESLISRKPWLVAFGFGLIHGFGFAGALSDIGLPPAQEFWALLLFNLGVEIGQVLFVCLVIAAAVAVWRVFANWKRPSKLITSYAIGTLGSLWFIERVVSFS